MPKQQVVNLKQYLKGWAAWGVASTLGSGATIVTLYALDGAGAVTFEALPNGMGWVAISTGLTSLGALPLISKGAVVMLDSVGFKPAKAINSRQRSKAARQAMIEARQRMAQGPQELPPAQPISKPAPRHAPIRAVTSGGVGREVKLNGKNVLLNATQLIDFVIKGPTSQGQNVEPMFGGFDDGPTKQIPYDDSPAIDPRWYVYRKDDQMTATVVLRSSLEAFLWWGYERQNTGGISHPWSRTAYTQDKGMRQLGIARQQDYHCMAGLLATAQLFEGRGQGTSGRLLLHPNPTLRRLEGIYPPYSEVWLEAMGKGF